jgi:O-acetyl-ADP-ribose deacetylase (regulator of RNase III)
MKVVQGDLIKMAQNGEFDAIVHGCNAFCTFGAGIARTVKDVFPEAYEVDQKTKKGNPRKLGTITFATIQATPPDALTIINAYTQFKYWKDKNDDPTEPLVDYVAVKDAFAQIKKAFGGKNLRFGIPKIGAGLAGGDWNTISGIIDQEMDGEDVTLVEFVG